MGAISERKAGRQKIKNILDKPDEVLVIHYSQAKILGDDNFTSPLITSIVIVAISGFEEHFSIDLEADKAKVPEEEIESNYEELEASMLKSFNKFCKEFKEYYWVHWEMKNVRFGFDAIEHRYKKVFDELDDEFIKIPLNKRVDMCQLLEKMYGQEFSGNGDRLLNLIKKNSTKLGDSANYFTLAQEEYEFRRKNFSGVAKSVEFKVNSLRRITNLLKTRNLKIPNKNRYSIFIEFIAHPIFILVLTLIGIFVGVLSLVL